MGAQSFFHFQDITSGPALAENTDSPPENKGVTTSTPSKAAEVALATTLATTPLPAVATVQHADHSTHSYQLTIQQLPGEDASALTERILAELEQRQQQSQREGLHDGL